MSEPKPPGLQVRPLDEYPAVHATNVMCALDGGAFVIHFYENRQVQQAPANEVFSPQHRAWVEVAKVALSPSAVQFLRDSLNSTLAAHEAAVGKMMSPAEYDKKLGDALQQKIVDSAMGLLKPPEQGQP